MKKLIDVARGIIAADLVLKNANIVNVYSGTIEQGDIAISDGKIAGIGNYSGIEEVDLDGKFVTPGFIDSHIHIESSMLTPLKFAEAAAGTGVTTVIADPHEIANVLGIDGIKFMIKNGKSSKSMDFKFMMPSCVPATPFETSGAVLSSEEIRAMIEKDCIQGLGEMMNYPGVLYGDDEVLSKIIAATEARKVTDGHAPDISGNDLNAYTVCGIKTEHEATKLSDAEEKLRRGMYVIIREGTATKNLKALIDLARGDGYRRLLFCSDDLHPHDLLERGSINYLIKTAIESGIDPVRAVAIASLNSAECYGLSDRGAVSPGKTADLVILDSLKHFNVLSVLKNGSFIYRDGKSLVREEAAEQYEVNSFNCKALSINDIKLNLDGEKYNVIGIMPHNVVTEKLILDKSELSDTLKIVVAERHKNTGNVGVGLIKGYGLKGGAVASSIAHDSHNIIAVGDNDNDIVNAVNEVIKIKGGIVISSEGKIKGSLSLPIAGLITDKSAEYVNNIYEGLAEIAKKMGVFEGVHPFMTLSFMALAVIPELKITDKGLFDVTKFDFTDIKAQ